MDDVARLPAADRLDIFRASAAKRGFSPVIVEKDFWVCWVLKRLFTLRDPPADLIFKGGTSLSKVWGLIDRFSEDVDLSFNRADLGFGGNDDPAQIGGTKQRNRRLDQLEDTCVAMIRDEFRPLLDSAFAESLMTQAGWSLEIDPEDPQAILFRYPSSQPESAQQAAYLRPLVKLELGARGEHWPSEEAQVVSFASEDVPQVFRDPAARIRVVAAERTFWEKATILHYWYHAGKGRPLRDRQTRHYYDIFKLANSPVRSAALDKLDLLRAVAEHKRLFFATAWARYAEAVPGTLRLVPPPEKRQDIERDYALMQEMIFRDAPSLEVIFQTLQQLEDEING